MADHYVKILFLGDPRTGKTALISKLAQRRAKREYRMSVGLPKTTCVLQSDIGEVSFTLMESPGHDDFSSNTRLFYRAAHIIFIVYSVNSRQSFTNIDRWVGEVLQ